MGVLTPGVGSAGPFQSLRQATLPASQYGSSGASDSYLLDFDLPHGLTVGLLLPYTIQFSASAASSRYAEVAMSIGIAGEGDKALTTALVKRLVELAQAIGVP